MEWGMANRLAQLIPSDGRCLFMPIDHGYFQGPTSKLEEPGNTIAPIMPYADAVFVVPSDDRSYFSKHEVFADGRARWRAHRCPRMR